MAISKNVTAKLENGIEFVVNNAYLKVKKVTSTKDTATAEVHWYKAKGHCTQW